jgi:substrate import-associated zinc metallohydrolase lipoprotein
MKRIKHYIALAAIFFVYSSCTKEDALPTTPIVGLGGETWQKGPIDNWLENEFLNSYNIEVKYKWDPYELNFSRNLVPIMENKVEPVMSAVKGIWIKPYEKVAGNTFIRRYAPKQFVLAGSSEYNDNGTEVLGQAEGGRKILLLKLNQFDKHNREQVLQLLHTIHHEFAHILHQTRLYPQEWKGLNPEWYTATWFNSSDNDAHQQGLVTAYAKASPDEDFVETVSILLVFGQPYFDTIVNKTVVPDAAKKILRRKETIVVEYFNRQFGIDFRKLQQETQAEIEAYIK